jgi:hypothetical protein
MANAGSLIGTVPGYPIPYPIIPDYTRFRQPIIGRPKLRSGEPARLETGRAEPLLRRVPDDGVDAVIVLAGGAAKIGVELLGAESGIGQAQRDIVFAGGLALLVQPPPISTALL